MLLEKLAIAFAKKKHKGHFRRDGKTPYFKHLQVVAFLVDTDVEKAAAYCHDMLEDNKATYQEIAETISPVVASLVAKLTHNQSDDYFVYINKIVKHKNDSVKRIKIADIVSNLSDNPSFKQVVKYNEALRILANCVDDTI
jgi:(p)ppGpp synthase/HD superfamily hydrolase